MITVEEILEYLNSDRVEDMTEEMHECSMRQSQGRYKADHGIKYKVSHTGRDSQDHV